MMDEKGRLFGKINIIDLLVILLVIVIAVVLGMKLTGHGGFLSNSKQGGTIIYTVKVSGVEPEVYNNIKSYTGESEPLMASGAIIEGSQIVDITSAPHTLNATITTQDGALVVPLDQDLLDLTFTIKAKVPDFTVNEVGTQEVRIGKVHTVKTIHFELANGTIMSCSWNPAA